MAQVDDLQIQIYALQERIDLLLNQSKEVKDLDEAITFNDDTLIAIQNQGEPLKWIKRGDFLTAVLGSVRRISNDPLKNEVTAIGQIAIGEKTGINDGNLFIGLVNFYPPSADSHITKIYYTF